MKNKALRKSILSLAYPLTVFFVIILLVNDHFLRIYWPSWITGKLGDFAWLVFSPLVIAFPLSILVPRKIYRREKIIGVSAILFVALLFGLAKTVPAFHEITTQLIEKALGYPSTLKRDPTDLITLPALLISWAIWKKDHKAEGSLASSRGWVVLTLAMMATVANQPAPSNMGITWLFYEDGTISAPHYEGEFVSQDGGLSWQEVHGNDWGWGLEWDCCHIEILAVEDQENVQYRFKSGRSIERSDDGGKTWKVEVKLEPHTEAQKSAYLENHKGTNPEVIGGPFEAIIDSETGHVIVSMGLEGVLVRTGDGEWNWISVGPYERIEPQELEVYSSLLGGEIVLSIVLAILILGTTVRHAVHGVTKRIWFPALVGIIWILSVISVKNETNYFPMFNIGGIFSILILLPMTVILSLLLVIHKSTKDFYQKYPRAFLSAVLASICGGLLFIVPYVLWIQGNIPEQDGASILGVLIGVGMGLATIGITRRVLQREYGEELVELQANEISDEENVEE